MMQAGTGSFTIPAMLPKKHFLLILAAAFFFITAAGGIKTATAALSAEVQPENPAPSLVLTVIIDGLSVSEWEAVLPQLESGGLRRFQENSAVFTNAAYRYAATVTGAGHATLATGALPAVHGIVANDWFDRDSGKTLYCTEDSRYHYLGGEFTKKHAGTSPALLKVPSLGDRLTEQTQGRARVFAVSGKDRAAILSAGKNGTAYFYSPQTGRFITSNYYMEDTPEWWKKYYAGNPQEQAVPEVWTPAETTPVSHVHEKNSVRFSHPLDGNPLSPGPSYFTAFLKSPFSNEAMASFTKEAIQAEQIGRNPSQAPDLLTLSFSAHDLINHTYGPGSPESVDDLIRLDQTLRDFFLFLDSWVPREKLAVIFSADHGFEKSPEKNRAQGLSAGRIEGNLLAEDLNNHLNSLFGPGNYVLAWELPTLYLNLAEIKKNGLNPDILETRAQKFLKKQEGIQEVFTRTQLSSPDDGTNPLLTLAKASWDQDRSGDLFVIVEKNWFIFEKPHKAAASHGSPDPENRKVPLAFGGPFFKPGIYTEEADMLSVEATLREVLGLPPLAAFEGKPFEAILNQPPNTSDHL